MLAPFINANCTKKKIDTSYSFNFTRKHNELEVSVVNRGNRRITRVAEPHNIEYQEAKRNRALRAACWWSKIIVSASIIQ